MSRAYYTSIDYLGGGVNDYSRPDLIAPGETPNTARNIRGEAESFKPRKGYSSFADEQSSTTVVALGSYQRHLSTNDRLMMVTDNNKLFKIDPESETTWTEIALGGVLTDTSTVNFSNYGEYFFIFNGVDKPILVNNTTVTQPFTNPTSVALADFLPSFGEVYNGSLFVAGVPTAPNVVFISKPASSLTPANIYDFSGTIGGYGNTDELKFPERVTAIKRMSTALVIFTVDSAYYVPGLTSFSTTVTFDLQPIGGAAGAVSQKSTAVVENDIFYLTQQKEIKSIRRGFSDTLSMITTSLSTKIQHFLNDDIDNDLSAAFAYYDEPNKLYKLYLKSADGTKIDHRVVGDIDQIDQQGVPTFYIDNSMPFSSGVYYKTDGLQQSYIGSHTIGQVYSDETGLADDDDAAIQTFRSTKSFTANNPTTIKNFREVVIFGEMTNVTSISVNVYVDNLAVASETITSSDLPDGSTVLDAGIGSDDIGSFAIADEGATSTSEFNDMKIFVKRITFRQIGQRLRFDFSTDGINNNYRIRHIDYGFIPRTRLFNPIIEK